MKKTTAIVLWVALCLLTGFISTRFQAEAIASWYPSLNKPPLTPPNIAFPIAWTILYVLMGISIGLVSGRADARRPAIIGLFVAQLLCNFLWSIAFFYFRSPLAGFIIIVLLEILLILYMVKVYPLDKTAALLFVPYILWVAFATYLNVYILLNN